MAIEQVILEGGALAVVCLIAYLLATHITAANRELAATNKTQGDQIINLVTNHLTHSDETLLRVCGSMDNNTEALKDLRAEIRRNH